MNQNDFLFIAENNSTSKIFLLCILCMKRIPKIIIQEIEGEISICIKCSCNDDNNQLTYDIEDYFKALSEIIHQNDLNKDYCITCKSNINNNDTHFNHTLFHYEIVVENKCYNHSDLESYYYCNQCFQCLCEDCLKSSHLNHSHFNAIEETKEINPSEIINEMEEAVTVFNQNIIKSKQFLSQLTESNNKSLKKFEYILKEKKKANRSLLMLSLLIIHTYKLFSPTLIFNLLQNMQLIKCNKRAINLNYEDIEEIIQAFQSYYKRNYILLIRLEEEFAVKQMKEIIIWILCLRNGNVSMLTYSQIMLLHDPYLNHLICEIPKIQTEYFVSDLIELHNGKVIGKAGKTTLIIWDFYQKSFEIFDYPSSFYLYQLSNDLVFSEEWGMMFLYDINTRQVCTQMFCSQDSDFVSLSQVCLELFDSRIVVASIDNVIHFLNSRSLQSKSTLNVHDRVYDLHQLDNESICGAIDSSVVVIDINQMVIKKKIKINDENIIQIIISNDQRQLICNSSRDIIIVDYKKLKCIKLLRIQRKLMEAIQYSVLIEGRIVIIKQNKILIYDNL